MGQDDILREMHAEGISRWPSIQLSFTEYEQHCRHFLGEQLPQSVLRPHAADLYLCCACCHQDPLALACLERESSEMVSAAIARISNDQEFVRETLQEFWQKTLLGPDAAVGEYRGQGPLGAWLRISATRLALDRRRTVLRQESRREALGETLVAQALGPESTLTQAKFHGPFRDALGHALGALSPKDRNLLRMHLVGQCTIDQIGRAYGVHRATAARWLEQIRHRILHAMRTELKISEPHLTDSEFTSVARMMGGELELELASAASDRAAHGSAPTLASGSHPTSD